MLLYHKRIVFSSEIFALRRGSHSLPYAKKPHPDRDVVFWVITVILIQDQENVFFNTSSKILFFNLYEKTAE